MKHLILVFLLVLFGLSTYSQDVIYRTNGEKVKCYIIDKDSANVYFSIIRHGDVISTSLPKSEISNIVYNEDAENVASEQIDVYKRFGGYEFFYFKRKLTFSELENVLESNPLAYEKINSAQSMRILSAITGAASGFFIGYPIGVAIAGGDPNWAMLGIAGGFLVAGVTFNDIANKKAISAVEIYNTMNASSSFWNNSELNLKITGNGIGVELRF
jgi:hypothetical protein